MSSTQQLATLIQDTAYGLESYTVTEVAKTIEAEHPDVVGEWLDEARFVLLTQFVGDHLRHSRHVLRERRKHDEGFSIFDMDFTVTEDDVRKRLGDMDGKDHLFVAYCYARDAASARRYEKMHRHIARVVGNRKTEEVFSAEQLHELFGGADSSQLELKPGAVA